jgi:hypothetical protein
MTQQKTYSSQEMIRRQLYEVDKILFTINPYGPSLYSSLIHMVEIAEKHEQSDQIIGAKQVLKQVKEALAEEMKWN